MWKKWGWGGLGQGVGTGSITRFAFPYNNMTIVDRLDMNLSEYSYTFTCLEIEHFCEPKSLGNWYSYS